MSRDRDRMNVEGMTWSEWAYAAAIPESFYRFAPVRQDHDEVPDPSRRFRKERKAWRAGEDPAE